MMSPNGTEHPHGTHDIPPHASCIATVLMITPTVLNTPTVLMISRMYHDIPHGTHDNPYMHHDIPHGPQDNPHGIEHPPRYCTHIMYRVIISKEHEFIICESLLLAFNLSHYVIYSIFNIFHFLSDLIFCSPFWEDVKNVKDGDLMERLPELKASIIDSKANNTVKKYSG